jgi:glyoxylase I family protein
MIRYAHTNIGAHDVERLAAFYKDVFGCALLSPLKVMTGEVLSKGSGIPDATLRGIWLEMPGFEENAPALELFQYADMKDQPIQHVNGPGLNHIAFEVSDIAAATEAVLAAGGSRQGAIVDYESSGGTVTFVFLRDPEGNIIELLQADDTVGND